MWIPSSLVVIVWLTFALALADGQGSHLLAGSGDALSGRVVSQLDNRIWVIFQADNGDIWFGSNGNGVYRFDGMALTRFGLEDGLGDLQVRDIRGVQDDCVLVSTNSGVFIYDGAAFSRVQEKHASTPHEGWRLNAEDVWVVYKPGEHGPSRYDGEVLQVLQLPPSPYEAIFAAGRPEPPFPVDGIYSIYKDRRGHVWFGTAVAGLCRYDGQTFSWMYEKHLTTTPSGGSFGIRSIYEDREGDYWICNTRYRYEFALEPVLRDAKAVLDSSREQGLPDSEKDTDANFAYFHAVTQDPQGSLWMVCGSEGVVVHTKEATKRYRLGDGVYALSLLCDASGKVWVGTLDHGVFVFDGDAFKPFTG
jgi:ligand-binding sensor domain-containing protein